MATTLTLDSTDTDAILQLMQRVAAELITPRFRALAAHEIAEKRPGDYVTIADRESERALTDALSAAAPGALIVGEEATAEDPSLLDRLAEADHAFVVDPLDGTGRFVRGSTDHAVLLAELRGGEAVRGWIWQPEHQLAVVAERGAGVYWNGEPMTPPAPNDPPRMTGARRLLPAGFEPVTERWCCGIEYPRLLRGDVDALAYGNPKPWDHAPGALMARELGGVARLLDGSDYVPGLPVAANSVLLVTTSAPLSKTIA